jgi:hypothetical protein
MVALIKRSIELLQASAPKVQSRMPSGRRPPSDAPS